MMGGRLWASVVGVLALAGMATAQPANDDCANATAISSLPFVDEVDTSKATTDPSGCGGRSHSVWYEVTAGAQDVILVVDASENSAYVDAVVAIYDGMCGAFGNEVDVGTSAGFNAVATVPAGTSVLLCLADGFGSGSGGLVNLQVFEAPEFAVGGPAYDWEFNRAGVAGNANGEFLVAWSNLSYTYPDSGEVRSQLFSRDGIELSSEFTLAPWDRLWPMVEVASVADEFVVTWEGGGDVLTQLVDATGVPQGAPFAANQTAPADFYHDVAATTDRFVVVWDDGPHARLFDATAAPLTADFQVSTGTTIGAEYGTAVSMAPDGRFVVVWENDSADTIYARRFDASGTPQGPEVVVAADDVVEPDVAMAPNGDFVVVWEDYNYDYALSDHDRVIAARAFLATGVPKGPAVQVNQIDSDRQHRARIASTGEDFVVTWENDAGRAEYGEIDMAARRIDANASPLGPEFLVNTVNRGFWQVLPNVGTTPAGDFMITYTDLYSQTPFGVDEAIMARGFEAHAYRQCPTVAPTCRATIAPGKSKILVRNDGFDPDDLALSWKWAKGAATAAADFGDPTTSDTAYLCLYNDDGGGAGNVLVTQANLPAGGLCAGRPCWKALGTPAGAKGFKYKDKERTPNGVLKAVLKPGTDGRSKIVLKAGRGNLSAGVAAGLPAVPVIGTLTAQLHVPATGACWGATFTAATAKRNGTGIFQASSD